MNTIEAKRIRIVDYLRLLGHEPVKVRGGQYWYLSPLRKEDTPSFKVNDRLNEWYDFGLSEGGSIIELAMLFLRTSSVSEVLRSQTKYGFAGRSPASGRRASQRATRSPAMLPGRTMQRYFMNSAR